MQLQMTRGNSDLSVAQVFVREHAVRTQTRRQIVSILSAKQTQKFTELMVRSAAKLGNRVGDD